MSGLGAQRGLSSAELLPLSIWCWQDAIKAVFLDRVNIVSEYDTLVRSPSFEMRLPSVVSLKSYIKPSRFPAFTRFNVFLRDRFTCQYCGEREDLTFDHVGPALKGGVTTLGERRRGLLGVQPQEGGHAAFGGADVAGARALSAHGPRPPPNGRLFPPNYLHATGWTISIGIANWSPESRRRTGGTRLAGLRPVPRGREVGISAPRKFAFRPRQIAAKRPSFRNVHDRDSVLTASRRDAWAVINQLYTFMNLSY